VEGTANLDAIRRAFCDKTYIFSITAYPKMQKLGLKTEDLEEAICRDEPEVIEDYPDDPRGPACLVLGMADLARPLHVVVGYGPTTDIAIEVVTVYEPDPTRWYDHRRRR
jgi:hypothetical protein